MTIRGTSREPAGWRTCLPRAGAVVLAVGMLLGLGPGATAGLQAKPVVPASPVPGNAAELERRRALEPTNTVVLLELGRLYHWEASQGDGEAVKKAEECLGMLCRLDPTNARARALLGSTFTLKARDAFLPTTKLKLARQGLAEMDAAVRGAPDDAEVRFTRVCNNVSLPGFFRRETFIEEDFDWLVRAGEAKPSRLEPGFRAWVALYHGLWLDRQGHREEARRRWNEGLAADPESPVAGRLREELDRTRSRRSRGKAESP